MTKVLDIIEDYCVYKDYEVILKIYCLKNLNYLILLLIKIIIINKNKVL